MIFNEIINFINFYYYVHSNFELNTNLKELFKHSSKYYKKKEEDK